MATVIFIDLDGTLIESVLPAAARRCWEELRIDRDTLKMLMASRGREKTIDHDRLKKGLRIFVEEITKAKPLPGVVEALKSVCSDDVMIVISSRAPTQGLENWVEKNDLVDYVIYLGLEDGDKTVHVSRVMANKIYSKVIFVGNEPSDFCANDMPGVEIVKIGVNVIDPKKFPEDVHVYEGTITEEILAKYI